MRKELTAQWHLGGLIRRRRWKYPPPSYYLILCLSIENANYARGGRVSEMVGFAPLAKCCNSSKSFADDESVHLVGPFVGKDRFEVIHMANYWIL